MAAACDNGGTDKQPNACYGGKTPELHTRDRAFIAEGPYFIHNKTIDYGSAKSRNVRNQYAPARTVKQRGEYAEINQSIDNSDDAEPDKTLLVIYHSLNDKILTP